LIAGSIPAPASIFKNLTPHKIFTQHFKNTPTLNKTNDLLQDCQRAAAQLRDEIKSSKIAAIDVIFQKEDLAIFQDLAAKTAKFEKILILGVGGSSLGGKTIAALKFQNRVEFLESLDPETIQNCFSQLNLEKTFFLVISKSGETIETICQTLVLLDSFEKLKIKNISDNFLFVTESETNSLGKIAKKIDAEILPHSNKIGGRYSCFSIVGMLPAILTGIDATKVRNGAEKIVTDFLEKDAITDSCAMQLNLYQEGFSSNVIMPYIDKLKNFTDWYRQIWAESLGKNNFGSTPINSMGTVDQHSQLQLYLEGPKDKFFTFITTKKHQNDFAIKDLPNCATLFGGKALSTVVKIEEYTTIEVLNKKQLPIRIFEIEKLDEETLGGLMMQMMLETIIISYAKSINPFDQPAVELRKDLAKKMLKNNDK
jgi:glucose-6-phosphate isomerase